MKIQMRELFEKLLGDWCNGLLRLQLRDTKSPQLYGGILCPACARIHGRCIDAVYPFMHMAARTGDNRYSDAAVALMHWSENVAQPDGSYCNEISVSPWKGTTVFAVTAIADALRFHGQLLDKPTREAWAARLRLSSRYLYDNVAVKGWNINYPAVCSYTMVLLGNLLTEPRLNKRGRELAHGCMGFLTRENKLLSGEGGTRPSPDNRPAVDLGYNVEESLPGLVLYSKLAADDEILEVVTDAMISHLEFMLPDGAWDNSWGTRNYKWTYWGSRTSDGCQPAYALMADREPAFAEAAYRNTVLMQACTEDGLLHGGPHYVGHRVPPCVHHTFCHAKALAAVLDHGLTAKRSKIVRLPREFAPAVREFQEIRTWLISLGSWRATVTAYPRQYSQSRHASGGALSMLWHQSMGPILSGSLTDYVMPEPSNMQANHDPFQTSLTPRLELKYDKGLYTNIRDHDAEVTCTQSTADTSVTVRAKLIDKNLKAPSEGVTWCEIQYRFRPKGLTILISMERPGPSGRLCFVLPIISPSGERPLEWSENSVYLKKPGGSLKVSSNVPLRAMFDQCDRVFNHVPGFEAIPLVMDWDPNADPELRIQVEAD